jgi:hypothetical protein
MRILGALSLLVLLSACNSAPEGAGGTIVVVDGSGAPIKGAILIPEDEGPSGATPKYVQEEINARASDAKGVLPADLETCLWDDGCYHFRIHKAGYEDAAMVVSRELFPPELRIVLKPPSGSSNPSRGRTGAFLGIGSSGQGAAYRARTSIRSI